MRPQARFFEGAYRRNLLGLLQSHAIQYACLPFRERGDGSIEVMLITSRGTRRRVIPKGWPLKGRKPLASAAREALEEAGPAGEVEGADRLLSLRQAAQER
jgi:hypothetical protein